MKHRDWIGPALFGTGVMLMIIGIALSSRQPVARKERPTINIVVYDARQAGEVVKAALPVLMDTEKIR